jgi:hypothetical protein
MEEERQNSFFQVVYLQRSRNAGFTVTMSRGSPRAAAPPCLPLDIKDSLKEDARLLIWGFLPLL